MTNVINTPAGQQVIDGLILALTGAGGILVGILTAWIKKLLKK